jgi:flagellar biosynthesis protein FlhG
VIDLGAGIDRHVRQLAGQARTVLVVTTDEPTALTDAYAFIKVVNALKPETDVRVVVNMAASPRDGERTYGTLLKACQSFLKRSPPLAGVVRQDRLVRDAIRAQMPLLTRSPNAEAAEDVLAIAARLDDLG